MFRRKKVIQKPSRACAQQITEVSSQSDEWYRSAYGTNIHTNIYFYIYRLVRSDLVEKPEGKRPLGRQRRRWVDNIRMDLVEVGWGGVDWTGLAQDRDKWRVLVNSVLNLRVP
jgi:hypothetical protein